MCQIQLIGWMGDLVVLSCCQTISQEVQQIRGLITKKILRLSYDVIITYDYRKLLAHRKIILRFFCN